MEIKSREIKLVDTDMLQENPKNNNMHPQEQIDRLAKIIKHHGFRNPLTVSNRSGFVLCGHGRIEAAKQLGMKQLPVIYQDFENEAQEYAHMTADNEIARWATLDLDSVKLELDDLELEDIDLLGIKDFELPSVEVLEPGCDEDEVPELKEDPITKKGDVWLLGEHRVMCGDSTMIDDVEKLMNGEKTDMVFTDPPYGMHLDADYSDAKNTYSNVKSSGGNRYDNLKGDHGDFSNELINTIFYFSYAREMFIWGSDYFAELLPDRNEGSWIVWDKRSNNELMEEVNADKAFGSSFELCWSKNKHKRLMARIRSGIFGVNNEQGNSKRVHPTEKPVQLAQWFFEKWCEGLNKCVDLYLGSGSTLIACEKTNRKCFGMELDEHYCDVIVQRWQKFTNKKAVLESNGKTYEELCPQE